MLTAQHLTDAGVDSTRASHLANAFSGLNWAQILAILQAILGAIGGVLPTKPAAP